MKKLSWFGMLLALGYCFGTTQAQHPGPAAPITAERVMRSLQQDLFIKPGVGFRRVRVGHPFDRVARIWGNPTNRETSLLTKTWIYQTVDDTSVIVRGGRDVDSIQVVAGVNSEFQSVEGARFGMAPYQVVAIYGNPDKRKSNLLSYGKRGIEFGFVRGALRSIKVFGPQSG